MKAYGTEEPKKVEVSFEERLSQVESRVNSDEFEKSMSARFLQAELRHRSMWKQDIQAALRGQLNDLVSHVEAGVGGLIRKEVTDQLRPYLEVHEQSQQQVRDVVSYRNEQVETDRENFTKGIEDVVAAIVLKILKEYWLLDSEGRVLDANQRPVRVEGKL